MNTTTNTNPYQYMGNDVSNLTDLDEMLASGGADFDIAMVPVRGKLDGRKIVDKQHQMLVRTDTDEVLAVHKAGYTPVPYRDILVSAADAMKVGASSAKIQTVGTIDGGKQFYASILIDRWALDPEGVNDTLDTNLAVLGSHDGTLGVMFAYASFRTICANQAPMIGKLPFKISAKHTKTVEQRMNLGLRALQMAPALQIELQQFALTLQSKAATTDTLVRAFHKFWGDPAKADEGRGRTRLENTRDKIVSLYEGDTCAGAVGETRWAVFNAFTEYLDHYRLGSGDTAREKMAKTTIVPGTWVETRKADVGNFLLAA